MKTCNICNTTSENFWKCNSSADGLRSYCVDCGRKKRRDYYYSNREQLLKKDKAYRESHKQEKKEYFQSRAEHFRNKRKELYIKNRSEMIEKAKAYYSSNKEKKSEYDKMRYSATKDRYTEKNKIWRSQNKNRIRELNYLRKKRLKQATLRGFEEQIVQIYRNRPEGHHIDHILPLNHPLFCGLHVPWNLQYLPAVENLKKGNKVP